MHRTLMVAVVTFLAIGQAQAQSRMEPAFNSPKLYNGQGSSRGNMNTKPYGQNSVANPHYSDSINNPYSAGSRYPQDRPSNFGQWAPDDK